jgi:hypothetical protein
MKPAMAAKVFRRAAELVEHGWCRWNLAQTTYRKSVSPLDTNAVRWCAVGAIIRASDEVGAEQGVILSSTVPGLPAPRFVPRSDLSLWNDRQASVEPVAAFFRAEAARLEEATDA